MKPCVDGLFLLIDSANSVACCFFSALHHAHACIYMILVRCMQQEAIVIGVTVFEPVGANQS